jgi:hypothetical protein
LYADLKSRAQLVAVIDSKDGRRRGSAFTVYRIPKPATNQTADSATEPVVHH